MQWHGVLSYLKLYTVYLCFRWKIFHYHSIKRKEKNLMATHQTQTLLCLANTTSENPTNELPQTTSPTENLNGAGTLADPLSDPSTQSETCVGHAIHDALSSFNGSLTLRQHQGNGQYGWIPHEGLAGAAQPPSRAQHEGSRAAAIGQCDVVAVWAAGCDVSAGW